MPDVRYRGAFAEAYIQSLALAAGLNVQHPKVDDDGVDVTIRYSGEVGPWASPGIDVQVKSWATPRGSDDSWHYDRLNEVQYNKLAGTNYQMPRYLVVLLVPAGRNDLAELLDDGLLLRHRAYYRSLADEAKITAPSPGRRHKVIVPKANVLTVSALRGLIHSELVGRAVHP